MRECYNVCKRIRSFAHDNKICYEVDLMDEGCFVDLAAYLGEFDISLKAYLQDVLTNLHPFMMREEYAGMYTCIIDELYCIMVKLAEDSVIVVGASAVNGLKFTKIRKGLPVIVSEMLSCEESGKECARVFVQRGLQIMPMELEVKKADDFYVVDETTVEAKFVNACAGFFKCWYEKVDGFFQFFHENVTPDKYFIRMARFYDTTFFTLFGILRRKEHYTGVDACIITLMRHPLLNESDKKYIISGLKKRYVGEHSLLRRVEMCASLGVAVARADSF